MYIYIHITAGIMNIFNAFLSNRKMKLFNGQNPTMEREGRERPNTKSAMSLLVNIVKKIVEHTNKSFCAFLYISLVKPPLLLSWFSHHQTPRACHIILGVCFNFKDLSTNKTYC